MNSLKIKTKTLVLMLSTCALLLQGCSSPTASTSLAKATPVGQITVVQALPKAIPSEGSSFAGSQYIFVQAESAALMLNPIPFVGEMAVDAYNQSTTSHYKDEFIGVDPYQITADLSKSRPLFAGSGKEASLYPYVVIQEGADDVYRMSLIFQLEEPGWTGRYLYHLPTKIPVKDIKKPSQAELDKFRAELTTGAQVLLGLIERDKAGQLKSSGKKVDVGSYYIVGSKLIGLISPDIMVFPNEDLVEETADHVIVRCSGKPTDDAHAGGLLFGVHYFAKDQLHSYKVH
ncbi:MAG: hypothetical protein KKF22_12675 [Gammaproteobacteria bacterium]|nr:hypothetical protein [Gammaproteobacteria bacterium]